MEKNSDMIEPVVVLRDVSKIFRSESGVEVKAIEAVNMTVAAGEFVAILGPTGCGKTTVLNLVAGLDAPDSGSIMVRKTNGSNGVIPYVFQHYTLFPWRTVLANVSFGMQMSGMSKRDCKKKAFSLLDQVGLGASANAYPHELSGGMRQRAAIAQSLALDSQLLVMDEPFGSLDDHTRHEMGELLSEIWSHLQMTILFVTHNIDEALMLADRVILFKGHPGKPEEEFYIEIPRPRDRLSTQFTALHVELRKLMSNECA
ncbi:MAG: hypothetical protein A2283_18595 [Lentisphaerae bacterium RIFOXYA12_FULL_48_11]|nr:MAG: hypothetical protein A2283_18595 [Lentisphaerae bacterium RIFOXYA12_FULL_48_11]